MLAARASIGQICQKLEVSEATFNRWRNQYGGMKAKEDRRLKKIVADLLLDKQILKDAIDFLGKD